MGAAEIASLVLNYGIPFTEYIINLIENKTQVTSVEWANLKALAGVSSHSELMDRLKVNGIDPNSPQGQSLLGLIATPLKIG